MPTVTRTHTAADQAAEAERARSLPVPLTVWECDTPAGKFRLRRLGERYALDDDGLRLFAADPIFGEIGITAVDDADAISSAKTLIFARWAEERDKMRAAFWPEVPAAEAPTAGMCAAVDSDDDLTADLDEPAVTPRDGPLSDTAARHEAAWTADAKDPFDGDGRADTPAEAAALG